MNILHVYKTYLPDTFGGVEQVINQLATESNLRGHQTEVFAFSKNPTPVEIHVGNHKVHRCKIIFELASMPFSLDAIKQFSQLAKKADVIHYHYPFPFADLLHFICRIKKPAIVTYHSDIVKQKNWLKFYKPLQKKFLKAVNTIVAASPNICKSSEVLMRLANKTKVIPFGISENIYPTIDQEKLNHWREKLGEKFFLFVGVLRYYKGLQYLIEAAKEQDHPIVIAGSGPMEQQLKQQALDLGLNHIIFLGKISEQDKVALLQLCYAFVFPSHLRSEAFGISLLEASMFSKPMITCEIGTGTTYVNINKETGMVVEPANSEQLADAMDALWEHPEHAKMLGQNARRRYEELFTSERFVESYLKLYQSLIATK